MASGITGAGCAVLGGEQSCGQSAAVPSISKDTLLRSCCFYIITLPLLMITWPLTMVTAVGSDTRPTPRFLTSALPTHAKRGRCSSTNHLFSFTLSLVPLLLLFPCILQASGAWFLCLYYKGPSGWISVQRPVRRFFFFSAKLASARLSSFQDLGFWTAWRIENQVCRALEFFFFFFPVYLYLLFFFL